MDMKPSPLHIYIWNTFLDLMNDDCESPGYIHYLEKNGVSDSALISAVVSQALAAVHRTPFPFVKVDGSEFRELKVKERAYLSMIWDGGDGGKPNFVFPAQDGFFVESGFAFREHIKCCGDYQ